MTDDPVAASSLPAEPETVQLRTSDGVELVADLLAGATNRVADTVLAWIEDRTSRPGTRTWP